MTKVLVVDDDPSLIKALRIGLTARGDDVATAPLGTRRHRTGRAAPSRPGDSGPGSARSRRPRGLPAIRQFSNVPIIVLSAYGDERRKVEALDGGADDFITKPFGMAELEARLRVAMRHAAARSGDESGTSTTVTVGDLQIDMVHHMATRSGETLPLTSREFDLLAYLARHAGKVCTHHMILKDVWGPGYGEESNYVRVYAHRLRRKLGDDDGRILRTVPGIGYQLTSDAPTE